MMSLEIIDLSLRQNEFSQELVNYVFKVIEEKGLYWRKGI